MLLPYPHFCAYFSLQTCRFWWWGCKNSFVPGRRHPCSFATPLITLWVPLLRYNGFAPASADWTYRGEGKIDKRYRTGLTEIV